jgi:hypothetical protein
VVEYARIPSMFLLSDDYWRAAPTKSKGNGLFAEKNIDAGTVIGDYLGRVIRTSEEELIDDSDNFYLMYYHDQASIFPDLQKPGIHLLNHSCTPNIWMYTYKGHTLFFSLRHIFKGEELTVNYLLSPQDKYCNPCTHLCKCESVMCSNTMHLSKKKYDAWSTFHDAESARSKKERVKYGSNLPKLSSYPTSIPDNPIYTLFGTIECDPAFFSDKKLPTTDMLRKMIRETGRRLDFPNLNIRILGISDNIIVSTLRLATTRSVKNDILTTETNKRRYMSKAKRKPKGKMFARKGPARINKRLKKK